MPLDALVLTKTDALIERLLLSIDQHQPDWGDHLHIVVVDDGLSEGCTSRLSVRGLDIVAGQKPFVFARNANIGLGRTTQDVLLLNDDVLIQTPAFVQRLKALRLPGYGAVSLAVSNKDGAGNPEQIFSLQQMGVPVTPLRANPTLCFVAVLLRRVALDVVGGLDERYVGYGYEDDDWCRRARAAGFSLGVTHMIQVFHGSHGKAHSTTFSRDPEEFRRKSLQNRDIYQQKWGAQNATIHA